jgi:phage tail protein X
MAVTQYITSEGERWDSIAQKAYGDPTQIALIINANQGFKISQTLPAGITINVPILEPAENSTDQVQTNLLPPWKR